MARDGLELAVAGSSRTRDLADLHAPRHSTGEVRFDRISDELSAAFVPEPPHVA